MMSLNALLSVTDLSVEFKTRQGVVKALENINFHLQLGETVGIVGESGSGKSVLSFTIMGILEAAGEITQGSLHIDGVVVDKKASYSSKKQRHSLSMIFQNPRTALNPIRTIGKQIMDVLKLDRHQSKNAKEKAIHLLEQVQIPSDRFSQYPFQLSGGMCQRVLIALALARQPKLLIADEPTTGLDVVTQESIMTLIQDTRKQTGMSTLLITHDLGLAASYCERIMVMHAGHIVEIAPTEVLFKAPKHPYTQKLIAAMPGLITTLNELNAIPGTLPDLRQVLPPCRYSQRCERLIPQCEHRLEQEEVQPNHFLSCWNPL